MPRSSPRKRQVVNYNEDLDDEKPRRNGVAGKAIAKVKEVVSKEVEEVKDVVSKVTGKRKAEPESQDKAPVAAPKAVKKRKTKGKEEDAMPLAERTAVASLKKGMYIGAHVSGAGGSSSRKQYQTSYILANVPMIRCSQCGYECSSHRRQCLRPLLKVTEEMDESSPRSGSQEQIHQPLQTPPLQLCGAYPPARLVPGQSRTS